MANIKVSEMTEATSFDDGDYTMIVQANQNKKISRENIFTDLENEISANTNNISNIDAKIGELTNLKTTVKSDVVNSINSTLDAEIYSTNEIKTNGVWIDGKPIYRRVISFGALPLNSTKSEDVSSWNIDRLIHLYGSTQNPTSGNVRPLLFTGNQSAVVRIDKQANNIRLITYDTTWNGYTNTEVIVEYTKTTD